MRIFLLACLFFSAQYSAGQLLGTSPYSALGLGDPINGDASRYFSMGGTSAALSDGYNINLANPASYARLKLTNFDIGVIHTNLNQQQGDMSYENGYTAFNYMIASFPLYNNLGLVMGIRPHTTRGFNINITESHSGIGSNGGDLQTTTRFQGSGGLNNVILGTGWSPFTGLSVGVNAHYFFGSNRDFISINFDDLTNAVSTRIEREVNVSSWQFETGVQYYREIRGIEYGIGGTYRFGNTLNQTLTEQILTYRQTANQPRPLDTILSRIDEPIGGYLASALSLGLSIGKRGEERPEQYGWSLGVDYQRTMGSEFSSPVSLNRGQFVDATRYSAGATLIPALAFKSLDRTKKFWDRTEYRIGIFRDEGTIMTDDTQIGAFGTSFGVAIPLRNRNLAPGEARNNMLNFSVSIGHRGTTDNNLVRENFTQFLIGITLSEKWFDKYKYR